MTRFVSPAAALAALFGASCLEAGEPWGLIQLEVSAVLDVGGGRLDAEGRLKTALDYRVELEAIDVSVEQVEVLAGFGGGASFDPASPPPGYTNCHNGHCHADDGSLVDFADIARELAGSEGAEVLASATGGEVAIGAGGEQAIVTTGCEAVSPCEVGAPSEVALVRARVAKVVARGRVFDARAERRLPEAGVALDLAMPPVAFDVAEAGTWRFGPGQSLRLRLAVTVTLPGGLFDGVDFATMDEAAAADALAHGLREGTRLIAVRRGE